jgi:membrane fusion protein, adhesin transport system
MSTQAPSGFTLAATPAPPVNSNAPALPAWSDRVRTDPSSRMLITLGGFLLLFLLWASTFELDRVTRGGGRVLPSVQNQLVQHLEGGIVSQILVREGQRVKRGDVLVRVTNQFSATEFTNTRTDVVSKELSLARMEAEARGDTVLRLPSALAAQAPEIAASEQALFSSRRSQIAQQLSIIDDQIRGHQFELTTLQARLDNLRSEEALSAKQLSTLERALAAEAVSESEVLDRRTQLQQLRTRIADVTNSIPQTRSELAESQGRRRDAWLRFVAENKEKIAELRLQMSKANSALGAFQDRASRADVRAPMDGIVNKVFLQTVGAVARPGDPLVEIVPVDKSVMIEAELAPKDRGRVWPGLPATVKVTAYDYAVHGGLDATVVDISPDAFTDKDGRTFYRVRLRADTSRFGSNRPVVPGMVAEIDIKSGKQTILNYLMSPVTDMRDKAFRE